jgi:hypothetical protein
MTIVSFGRDEMPPLTEERKAELRALAERPDSEIDYSEIPKVTDFSGFMGVEEFEAFKAAKRNQATTV